MCQCTNKSMQSESESLFTKFASLSRGNETMPSECASWLCYYIHLLSLVTQVMETCALSLDTSGHFNLSLSIFLTMSSDRVAPSVLVTYYTQYMCFGFHPLMFVAWDIFDFFLLIQMFHVHVHQTWLCILLCREIRHLEHFLLLPPSCTSTQNLLSSSSSRMCIILFKINLNP